MGEEDDTKINSFFNILNDLANDKKSMMKLMGQLTHHHRGSIIPSTNIKTR